MTTRFVLEQIDAYCDAAPRLGARPQAVGSLVLFVNEGPGWPYYARPRRGAGPPSADDVAETRARQRQLGVPEAFEWIDELSPGLAGIARAAGLEVREHPLMIFRGEKVAARRAPEGVELRLATPEDDLGLLGSVAAVGFAHGGTAVGQAGLDELTTLAAGRPVAAVEFERERLRIGATVLAVAFLAGTPVASGMHQPVGSVSEIVGVATLPAFRRRGLGAALTALLVEDARARGLGTVFLSAGSEEIARLYGSLGFARIGTACIAAVA